MFFVSRHFDPGAVKEKQLPPGLAIGIFVGNVKFSDTIYFFPPHRILRYLVTNLRLGKNDTTPDQKGLLTAACSPNHVCGVVGITGVGSVTPDAVQSGDQLKPAKLGKRPDNSCLGEVGSFCNVAQGGVEASLPAGITVATKQHHKGAVGHRSRQKDILWDV